MYTIHVTLYTLGNPSVPIDAIIIFALWLMGPVRFTQSACVANEKSQLPIEEWSLLGCYAVWILQEPHGVTSQKTIFFIVTAVNTSDLTQLHIISNLDLKLQV
jgi:hypothetical protein